MRILIDTGSAVVAVTGNRDYVYITTMVPVSTSEEGQHIPAHSTEIGLDVGAAKQLVEFIKSIHPGAY